MIVLGANMSLIIAYVGKKGCVMAADKRRIAYFGDKESREQLEEEIYSGSIIDDNELQKRAKELDVALKITDDASKIRQIEDVIVGEVSSRSTSETKRKRIYGSTNGYQIIEMSGSKITDTEKGEKAIILFGNKISKSIANNLISKKWKSSFSLKYMGEIFENILEEVSMKTPSVGKGFDVLIKNPTLSNEESQEYIDDVLKRDIELLGKWREKLQNDLMEQNEMIKMASKIIAEGSIGKVNEVNGNILKIALNSDVQAFDPNWKQLAKPGDNVIMILEEDVKIMEGDEVVIENEVLCLKNSKTGLKCDIILCNL